MLPVNHKNKTTWQKQPLRAAPAHQTIAAALLALAQIAAARRTLLAHATVTHVAASKIKLH